MSGMTDNEALSALDRDALDATNQRDMWRDAAAAREAKERSFQARKHIAARLRESQPKDGEGQAVAWSEILSFIGMAKMSLMKNEPDHEKAMIMLGKVSDSLDTILSTQPAPSAPSIVCEHCPSQFHGDDDAAAAGGWVSGWDGWECPAHKRMNRASGITPEWVADYLTTDMPQEAHEAIRNAFSEWAALHPLSAPSEQVAASVAYDRELIAEMLGDLADHGAFTGEAVAEQIRLIREADNAEASRVHTAAAPVAPAPVAGWLQAVDTELVNAHLGVANAGDDFDTARRKLSELIQWHIDVSNDPRVNGALVAGDAVAELPADWRRTAECMRKVEMDRNLPHAEPYDHCAQQLDEALAQDRASQPLGGGVTDVDGIRDRVRSILSTVSLGHQTGRYAYVGEDFGEYLAVAARDCRDILHMLPEAAAPQPAAAPTAPETGGENGHG